MFSMDKKWWILISAVLLILVIILSIVSFNLFNRYVKCEESKLGKLTNISKNSADVQAEIEDIFGESDSTGEN